MGLGGFGKTRTGATLGQAPTASPVPGQPQQSSFRAGMPAWAQQRQMGTPRAKFVPPTPRYQPPPQPAAPDYSGQFAAMQAQINALRNAPPQYAQPQYDPNNAGIGGGA